MKLRVFAMALTAYCLALLNLIGHSIDRAYGHGYGWPLYCYIWHPNLNFGPTCWLYSSAIFDLIVNTGIIFAVGFLHLIFKSAKGRLVMACRYCGLHLATVLVFILLAVVLIVLNFVPLGERLYIGFPIRSALILIDKKVAPFGPGLDFNVPFCLLLIILTTILCEWLIRRRERMKQEGEQEKARRPWFQYHLSTLLLLMLVGGAFLGPFVTTISQIYDDYSGVGMEWSLNNSLSELIFPGLITVSLLILLAVVLEWFIRRRERQKQEKQEGGK